MNKEELIEKAQELTIKNVTDGKSKYYSWGFHKGCVVGLEYNNKHIADLEEKISILLSCKNCPENKDGLICQKEYEGKCLAQKIQFIKELKEENAELKAIADFQTSSNMDRYFQLKRSKEQLTKAKKIIEELYNIIPASMADYAKEPMEHARKFMTEE